MSFQYFQAGHHGGHLGFRNWTNLAILNLHVTLMPPSKVEFNLTCCLEADMVWRFSSWPPWGPSWISERNDFSNSESLCCSDASHQVWAQSNLQFGRIDWLSWGLTTHQPLWVILCRLPEKGRKEIEEIAEEMKERNREWRGTGMKEKK